MEILVIERWPLFRGSTVFLQDFHLDVIFALQFALAFVSTLMVVVMASYCCRTNSTTFDESVEMIPAEDLNNNNIIIKH